MQKELEKESAESAPTNEGVQPDIARAEVQAAAVPQPAPVPAQPEPISTPPPVQPLAAPAKKPLRVLSVIWTVFKWLFVLALLGAVGFLGYRLYTTTADLETNQKNLARLQTQFDQLKTENEGLSAELEQTQATLADTEKQLAGVQADLKDEQEKSKAQQARLKEASKLVDVAIAIFVNSENDYSIAKKVKATNNTRLVTLYDEFVQKPGGESFLKFLSHLFEALSDKLK